MHPSRHPMDRLMSNTSPAALLTTALGGSSVLALEAIRQLKERLEEEEQDLVFHLRHGGATWQEIANLTGMASRQAAQKRYETGAGAIDRLDHALGRKRLPL